MSENPYTGTGHVGDTSTPAKGPRVWVTVLTVFAIVALLIGLLLPDAGSRGPSPRTECQNNLKQISLALHTYEAIHHALPPAYTVDSNGKPLHSWRTLILPFLDHQPLYDTIDLSKPWDDPANAKAFNIGVAVYCCPASDCPANHTTYLAVVAPNGCFRPTEPRPLSEITDNQTLMVIEGPLDRSVHWMSPQDADEQLVMGLGPDSKLSHVGGVNIAFVDGSVRFLTADLPAAERRAMISIAGNDEVAKEHQ